MGVVARDCVGASAHAPTRMAINSDFCIICCWRSPPGVEPVPRKHIKAGFFMQGKGSAFSFQLSAFSFQLSAISYQLSALRFALLAEGSG